MKLCAKRYILIFSLIFTCFLLFAQRAPQGGGMRPGSGAGGPEAPGAPGSGKPGEPGQFPHPLPPPPPKDSDKSMKYRGNRTYTDNLPLRINQTECLRKDGEFVSLGILFNKSINPRSVRPGTILINNKPLPPHTRFAFNKKGDTVKIFLPMNNNTFKLKIFKIRSFDGSEIDPVELLIEVQSNYRS